MPRLLAPLVATAALLIAAPAAVAGQILFAHSAGTGAGAGSDIWIMDDDGTDARPFITRAQIPDGQATTLSDPAVDESTGAVLFNGFVGTFGGTNGLAVYMLKDGKITRLSRGGTQSGEGTTTDEEPQPFGNGSFIIRGQGCTGETCSLTVFETQSMADTAADGQLETRIGFDTACGNTAALTHPAPNPANAAQVAYGGCMNPATFEPQRMLIVSGPGRAGEKLISIDDEPQHQAAWRADGGQLAAVERASDAGVYVYDPNDDTQDKRRVVAVPSYDSTLSSVTFQGNDSLVFDRSIGGEGQLLRAAVSCTDCPADQATVIKADAGKSSTDPEWTPRTALPGIGGSGGGGGGGGGGQAPTGLPNPESQMPSGVGPDPLATFAKTQRLARGFVLLTAGCTQACRYTTRGSNLRIAKKSRALKTVSRDLGAGQKAKLQLKLSKATVRAARAALRKGKKVSVELVLSAYYDGGKRVGGPLIRKVRLR